jgi:hypothetical protein
MNRTKNDLKEIERLAFPETEQQTANLLWEATVISTVAW